MFCLFCKMLGFLLVLMVRNPYLIGMGFSGLIRLVCVDFCYDFTTYGSSSFDEVVRCSFIVVPQLQFRILG